ncbi:glycosyltransferase family 2 protein [Herbiconiux ginsengi]|nr:glycosyltransferase family 2 protein [Herbiconiux ginsengi]
MTLMVRDEADIISAMIDHHLAQGVDTIIVTDNGSVDGTTAILEEYSARGLIDLRHDPVQRKQQWSVVTAMARDAYTLHQADWVLNADADEFWLPRDRSRTLKEVFSEIPKSYQSFPVPVVNLTGRPAATGSGLQRLVYRDERPTDALHEVGIRAHPTSDAPHIGSADVHVSQGNHEVSLESRGRPGEGLEIEVLHLPWRSWSQYRNKVEATGLAYESNPGLAPSPNHHGMRDYARLKAGILLPYYLLRHPDAEELRAGEAAGSFTRETVLAERLTSPVADTGIDAADLALQEHLAPALRDAESRVYSINDRLDAASGTIQELRDELDRVRADRERIDYDRAQYLHGRDEAQRTIDQLNERIAEFEARRAVKLSNGLRTILRRPGQ